MTDVARAGESEKLSQPRFEVGRDDAAARAAVHRADATVAAVQYLPARTSDAVP